MYFGSADFVKELDLTGLPKLMERPPDFIIGPKDDPYLKRWHLVPRNKFSNVYLHEILKDDDDRALHDHPWDFQSIILRGSYIEYCVIVPGDEPHHRIFHRGDLNFHRAEHAHRLQVLAGPVVTLVFTGPSRREWGFQCPKGWRHWREFCDDRDQGLIGKGCE
jgi:hypothetical protein